MTSTHSDDAILIQRAQAGDRSSFDALVSRHESRAYQYAYRLTSNQEDACDIVSEAFVRVFTALKNFKGNSAFSTWLYRILTNCYLDQRKKEKAKQTLSLETGMHTESGEVERQVEDESGGPSEALEQQAREAAVQTAIVQLPEYQRAMLIMYHVENLTYEEMAEALDLPLGTVKSRLNRARLSLRELLIQDQELFEMN